MLFRTLILCCVLSNGVLGGSAIWQPKLEYRSTEVHIAVNKAGYSVTSETSSQTKVQKRWLALKANENHKLWPEQTVSYCFASTSARNDFHKHLKNAIDLWKDAGLSRLVYKYKEVADAGKACTDHADRAVILVIDYLDPKSVSAAEATVGLEMLDENNPSYKGPEMQIGANNPKSQISSIIAHELGHVWGLYHEHQNRLFWGLPYSPFQGQVFGSNFHCNNLPDYNEVVAKINAKGVSDPALEIRLICESYQTANYWGFSATNWLPQPPSPGNLYPSNLLRTNNGPDKVDWDSIMIYQGDNILQRNDGSSIWGNAVPSQADVDGIKHLYENAFSAYVYPTLPNSTKSPWYTKFIAMFRKKKDCK